jgi:hypothetical protein
MGKWGKGKMGKWENGEKGKWENGKMGKWGNGEMGKREDRKMGRWENGNVYWRKLENGKMRSFRFTSVFERENIERRRQLNRHCEERSRKQ